MHQRYVRKDTAEMDDRDGRNREGTEPLGSDLNRDRRRYPRVCFQEPVQFRASDIGPQTGSLSCDLSCGGVRINVADFLPFRQELLVDLQLGTEDMVQCRVRVVWTQQMPFSDRYQSGLEFLEDDMDRGTQEILAARTGVAKRI